MLQMLRTSKASHYNDHNKKDIKKHTNITRKTFESLDLQVHIFKMSGWHVFNGFLRGMVFNSTKPTTPGPHLGSKESKCQQFCLLKLSRAKGGFADRGSGWRQEICPMPENQKTSFLRPSSYALGQFGEYSWPCLLPTPSLQPRFRILSPHRLRAQVPNPHQVQKCKSVATIGSRFLCQGFLRFSCGRGPLG